MERKWKSEKNIQISIQGISSRGFLFKPEHLKWCFFNGKEMEK